MTGSFDFLKNYDGQVIINGNKSSSEDLSKVELLNVDEVTIQLIPKCLCEKQKFRIYVRPWMANNSGDLDFHKRWNGGIPMPNREMYGDVLDETAGMYYMNLRDNFGNTWKGYVSKAAIIDKEIME